MARRLLALLGKRKELEKWQFTDTVLIDDTGYSHSHPTLTIGTKSPFQRTDAGLMSTYLHEQMHWFVSKHPRALAAALKDLRGMYPKVAVGTANGSARDEKSTYLHLLVCFLELDALSRIIGIRRARALMMKKTYYRWIYSAVLTDFDSIKCMASKHSLAQ